MKKTIILLVLQLISFINFSQVKNDYLYSEEIDSLFNASIDPFYLQHLSVRYMYIGDFQRTLFMEEQFVENYKKLKKGKITLSPDFENYQAINASEAILKRAKNHQIVIINEAHYSAQNRVFISSILKGLYIIGYENLFVEGLYPDTHPDYDSLMNERKYPITSAGYYFKEPQFGNLLRHAMSIGMRVNTYEHDTNHDEPDPIKRWYSREEGQANNVLAFLKQNPKAKIIIHCGYGHLGEKIIEGEIIGMMSAVIKKKSGIDPFTISQTKMLETHSEKFRNPYRRLLDGKKILEPSVFVNEQSELFSVDSVDHDVDVYFPPTKMVNGRPDWLFLTGNKKSVKIPTDKINMSYPYFVFAFHQEEDVTKAIAADIVEIKSSNDYKALILQAGKYKLMVKSKTGESMTTELEVN